MNASTSLSGVDSSTELNEILDRFIAEYRSGLAPSVEKFSAQHPQFTTELLELLPAMIFAEQLNVKQSKPATSRLPDSAQVGPFVLVREIGRGGMGIVYEATHQQSLQSFALKLLQPRFAKSTTLRTRFIREAEAAAKLHHPHIVPAKYYGSDDDNHYLVMQLIDGVSLDRLMNAEATCDTELVEVFRGICGDWTRLAALGSQVCSALAHSHEQGMIHRDIKPANLMLDRKGNIWVTDFGLAKVYEDDSHLTRKGEVLGTPRYMSPEQIFGISDVRSDVYCLGLTLYELILYGQGKSAEWLELQQANNYVLELPALRRICPAVPKGLSKIVMKACAHHPAGRYQSAREFEFTLNQFRFGGHTDRRSGRRRTGPYRPWMVGAGLGLAGIAMVYSPATPEIDSIPAVVVNAGGFEGKRPEPMTYLPPDSNCVTFKDPDSDIMNVWASVNRREDDVEEYAEGDRLIMYIDSGDLELTWDEVDQLIGLRFPGVQIPRDAVIESAVISFWAERTERIDTQLRIHCIDEDNLSQFTPVDGDLSRRKRTAEFVEWTVPPWVRGQYYESESVASLVQRQVRQSGWNPGNAIGFVIDGKGQRVATAFDGNIHYGPMLKVRYSLPRANAIANDASLADNHAVSH